MRSNQFSGDLPLPRTFYCANCGQKVVVTEPRDRRFRYCCQKCEKDYWRKVCKSKKRNK